VTISFSNILHHGVSNLHYTRFARKRESVCSSCYVITKLIYVAIGLLLWSFDEFPT